MSMRVQLVGLVPFTSPRTSYDTTGAAVSFRRQGSTQPRRSTHLSLYVYTGTALVALDGNVSGPFIELGAGAAFDFPIETEAVYVKGSGAATEVAVVAAINPVEEGTKGRVT